MIKTDILIIGGGTAGCRAAIEIAARAPGTRVLIAEKADIRRSGCLAAGVNALNACVTPGHVPQDYVDYAKNDAAGIVREDLLLSMSEHLNEEVRFLERLGVVFLRDEKGRPVSRGWRNLKINGENLKPLLADAVRKLPGVRILNHVNVTDLAVQDGVVRGAYGFSLTDGAFLAIAAKAVLVATGGAAGLYRPNHPGASRHKMWYPPFNTGAGYAMGIRAGAEMTTFEMRFVALRCKDTLAPTGTLAQGVGARQVNAKGEVYETKYGLTTSERVYGTTEENRQGRGPCYLRTVGISPEAEASLMKAYLNMAPAQTLKWLERGKGPSEENVEIEGSDPYIVGGHTASGYWVDVHRATTIRGLFAAGDVAGGCPQKYVTGALVEGRLAADSALAYASEVPGEPVLPSADLAVREAQEARFFGAGKSPFTTEELEEAMQTVMDESAGGRSTHYRYSEAQLKAADGRLAELAALAEGLRANGDTHELLFIHELRERLVVARVLIAHLLARKETRWPGFGVNLNHPKRDDKGFLKFVNSRQNPDGSISIILRDL